MSETFETHPTVLLAEASFISLAIVTLIHAGLHDRQHVLMWLAAVVSGTANDVIFMVLPFVDNFFHAQMTLMLTPRLPLYICCAYIAFQYCGCVAAWRLELPVVPQAAASALAGALFYSSYDITGAKFLWWSWHDTDGPIFERWLGVPCGSTMWTLVHVFVYSLILHGLAYRTDELSNTRFAVALLGSGVLTTPAMFIAMGPFQLQQLRLAFVADRLLPVITRMPGKPDQLSLGLVIAVFSLLVNLGLNGKAKAADDAPKTMAWLKPVPSLDRMLLAAVVGQFCLLTSIMAYANPATIVSTGAHQEYGECHVKEVDLMGYEREAFLCKDSFNEDYTFDCAAATSQMLPPALPTWFTICGRAHVNYALYVGVSAAIGLCGVISYTAMLLPSWGSNGKVDAAHIISRWIIPVAVGAVAAVVLTHSADGIGDARVIRIGNGLNVRSPTLDKVVVNGVDLAAESAVKDEAVAMLSNQIGTVYSELAGRDAELVAKEATAARLTDQLRAVTVTLATKEGIATTLNSQLDKASVEFAALEKRLAATSIEFGNLEKQHAVKIDTVAQLTAELAAASFELAKHAEQLDAKEGMTEKLKSQLSDHTEQLTSRDGEIATLSTQLATASTKCAEHGARLTAKTDAIATLTNQLALATSQHTRCDAQLVLVNAAAARLEAQAAAAITANNGASSLDGDARLVAQAPTGGKPPSLWTSLFGSDVADKE